MASLISNILYNKLIFTLIGNIFVRREIVHFLDPKNPHWSRYEAINLLSQADRNDDNLLDLEEVFAKPDLFLFSKFVSGDAGFHGEF